MSVPPSRPAGRPGRPGRRLGAVLGLAGGVCAAAVTAAVPAAANPAGPHDPIGHINSVTMSSGRLVVTGWAADPDALTSNATVGAVLDGTTSVPSVVTSLPRPAVATKHHTGPTAGFRLAIPVPKGMHTACVDVHSIGQGLSTVLACYPLPYGTKLTAAQRATHSPRGSWRTASAGANSFHVAGWAVDPDVVGRHSTLVLYLDGHVAATFGTARYTGARPSAAGVNSRFAHTLTVPSGTHVGCLWVVNVGLGANTFLGCKAADTRGTAGSGAVHEPALNRKVLAEAKRHLGQPYVWGATGPKRFDCSGLVMYSYAKNGYRTPRVSEDQFAAARLIPASRAVPGDLVFYSSSAGDIYHVGIVSGPGMSVAAVDPQEGVTHQRIYLPSNETFFGSFTHT